MPLLNDVILFQLLKLTILISSFWLKLCKNIKLYVITAFVFEQFYRKNPVDALARLAKIFCYNGQF